MSTVENVVTHKVALPTRRAHEWASSVGDPIGTHLLIEVRTSDGAIGWGETTPMATWGGAGGRYDGSTVDATRVLVERCLAPHVVGHPVQEIAALHQRMDAALKGNSYAKAGLEMACFDAAAREMNVPLHALLGGAVRRQIRTCHSLGIMPQVDAITEGVAAAGEGARSIKVKTARKYASDVGVVAGLRKQLGEDVEIRVDANEGYPDVATAVRITREQEAYRISLCEQPLGSDKGLAQVRSRTATAVMADESAWSVTDVARLHATDSADAISLYATKAGGLLKAVTVGRFAEAMGMACDIGGSVEFGIGTAANLHLAAVLPAVTCSSVLPLNAADGSATTTIAGRYYTDDVITGALDFSDGCLRLPAGPGLGVDVDLEKVQRYSV